ncbi:MAG TPA: hypothetical protein VKC59_06650 [Candidatus Limnocylindrales bacterium]|nr:hypothetical protein [Candidatus Limnocylindrales bacterium]
MNPALTAVAVAVAAGAIVAVSSRDPRAALIGLAAVLVGSAFLIDPLPGPAALGVRIVGGLLCVSIVRLAVLPEASDPANSPLGWPAEAFLAVAAAVGGGGVAIGLAIAAGPGTAIGGTDGISVSAATSGIVVTSTATALFAIGVTPAAIGGRGIRRTVGIILVAVAVVLLRIGFAGAPSDFEEIAIASLLVGCAIGGVGLARAAAPAPSTARALGRGDAFADPAEEPL